MSNPSGSSSSSGPTRIRGGRLGGGRSTPHTIRPGGTDPGLGGGFGGGNGDPPSDPGVPSDPGIPPRRAPPESNVLLYIGIGVFLIGGAIGLAMAGMVMGAIIFALVVFALGAAGFAVSALTGGGHGANDSPGEHAGHLEGIHENDLKRLKIPAKTWGRVPMGNTHSDRLVLRYKYFGDKERLYVGGDGAVGWFRFGRHYIVAPWLEAFFVDTSDVDLQVVLEITPHGSVIPVPVPATVTLSVLNNQHGRHRHVSEETVEIMTTAHDGKVTPGQATDDHRPVDFSWVVTNMLNGALNLVELGIEPAEIAPFLNTPSNMATILRFLNHGNGSDGLNNRVGLMATKVVFGPAKDEVGRKVETTRRMVKEGVNPNVAGSGGTGGGGGDLFAMAQAALMGWLGRQAGNGNPPSGGGQSGDQGGNPPSGGGQSGSGGGGTRRRP